MKKSGINRRIDSLGRIVIPREIRNYMHLKPGDLLDISIESSDSLLLKKYSELEDVNIYFISFLNIISNTYNINLLLTDKEKIIYSNNKKELGKIISETIINNKDEYIINPNGDYICSLYFDKNTEKDIKKIVYNFVNNYFIHE